ncbi:MAG TPA: hypothetical protein VE958_12430 [Bryobacteraceae bacterium]|jgi:hypothetical protein|nr:hypothetical protein [Bryobacteraceae bacterium]
MNPIKLVLGLASLVALSASASWAARCVTALDSRLMPEYDNYVQHLEATMASRLAAGELSWVPEPARKDAQAQLQSGRQVRWNVSDQNTNRRVAGWNGTIVNWVGAIRIRGARLQDLREVLQDYGRYSSMYNPLIYDCRAKPLDASGTSFEVTYGFQNIYRAASVFPQHFTFEVQSRTEFADSVSNGNRVLTVHSRSSQIRESDSGVPGRNDLLEPHHDHGIMWALNTYWRARQVGPDLYAEFEFVDLTRSVQEFMCRIGIIPVPKAAVSRVIDTLPPESIELMLSATKAECERRAAGRSAAATR